MPVLTPSRYYLPAYLAALYRFSLRVAFIVTIITLVLTQSRGGWLGGIAAPGSLGRTQKQAAALVTGFRGGRWFLGLVVWWAGQQFWPTFSVMPPQSAVGNLGTPWLSDGDMAAALWGVGDFPFTGMGMGTFREVARLLYPLNIDPSFNISDAHNQFLQAALDLGLPGLIAFVALWIGAGYCLVQLIRYTTNPLTKALSIGMAGSLFWLFYFRVFKHRRAGREARTVFLVASGVCY